MAVILIIGTIALIVWLSTRSTSGNVKRINDTTTGKSAKSPAQPQPLISTDTIRQYLKVEKLRALWNGERRWVDVLIAGGVVWGCHYLLSYFLPEVWTALAVKPFFWASHVFILLIFLFARKDAGDKDKSKKLTMMAKVAIGVIILINVVQFFGPPKKNGFEVGLKSATPSWSNTTQPQPSQETGTIIVIVPATGTTDSIPITRKTTTSGGDGTVWIIPDRGKPVLDGPGVKLDGVSSIKLKSGTGKPVEYTITR